jgi:hypothetical protein
MINKIKKISVLFFLITILFCFALPPTVFSQQLEYAPLSPIPGTVLSDQNKTTNITMYLIGMFRLIIGVAGALAVVMIVIGGIQYMSTDAIYGKSEGKEKIKKALSGLLLAIMSWLILNTINPEILKIKFDFKKTTGAPSGSSTTTPNVP